MNRRLLIFGSGFTAMLGLALWATDTVLKAAPGRPKAVEPETARDPYQLGRVAFDRGDIAAAVAQWTRISETDARAQAALGDAYAQGGLGVEADSRLALSWYYRAAAVMNTHAEMALGRFFAEGRGVPVDFGTSGFWFRNAGMHGAADGAYIAGTYLEAGRGTRADAVDAAAWYALSGELGNPDGAAARDRILATFSLGQRTMYEQRMHEFHEQRRTGDTTLVGAPQP